MDCLYEFEPQTLFYWPLMTQSYVCFILRWKRTHARSYIYVVVDLIDLKVLNVKRFSLLSEYPFVELLRPSFVSIAVVSR